jgi:uncharacterized surface protein with fasciclin (FAS1) repeats
MQQENTMNMFGKLALVLVAVGATACSDDPVDVETRTILQVAREAGTFTTLVAAVQAAGLEEVLDGEGPFTVFAPNDEAFGRLPAGTVEALLANPTALAEILTYHVVAGRVTSADITRAGGAQPVSVQGQPLMVEVASGIVRVEGATVLTADVEASNGVIHVIDAVMIPDPR